MKILITGASGFIGSNLLKFLNKKKFSVTGLSNSHNNNYSVNSFSLLSKKKINQFFHEHDFDFVIHLGASLEELNSINTFKKNCQTTINLFMHLAM